MVNRTRCYFDEVAAKLEPAEQDFLRTKLLDESELDSIPNAFVHTPCRRVGPRCRDRDGYTVIGVKGTQYRRHRLALALSGVRDDPELVVDHLCRTPDCIEVSHLELTTRQWNTLRGSGIAALNAAKFACHRSHLFTPDNTVIRANGSRACRRCMRANWRRYYAIKRALATAGAAA